MLRDAALISYCRCGAVVLLAVIATSVVSGCAFQPAPGLEITDTRITETSDDAFVLTFDLDLRNPSDQPQELREMHYELLVDGVEVYRGRRAPLATLKGDGRQRIQLPAVVRYDRLQGGLQGAEATARQANEVAAPDATVSLPERFQYKLRGSILYIAPGHIAEILLDTGVRRPRLRFSEQGEMRLAETGIETSRDQGIE